MALKARENWTTFCQIGSSEAIVRVNHTSVEVLRLLEHSKFVCCVFVHARLTKANSREGEGDYIGRIGDPRCAKRLLGTASVPCGSSMERSTAPF